MEGFEDRPSGELVLAELDYLRQYEEDFIQPPSAAQSLGASDCGPSVSFPPPPISAPLHPPLLPNPTLEEDQILEEWERVQKIRIAAAKAAEVARHHAEEVARLEAAVAAEQEITKTNLTRDTIPPFPTSGANSMDVEHQYVEERIVTWPPDTRCVPLDYNVASHNAPVLEARAQRVLELGNYFATQQQTREGLIGEDAVKEVAKKVGGYQNLAKIMRHQITQQQQK